MIVAVAGELSWFSLLTYPANFLIPITRYVGFVWMVAAAVKMAQERRTAPVASPVSAA